MYAADGPSHFGSIRLYGGWRVSSLQALYVAQSAASANSSVAVISIAEAILRIETMPGF